jgi:hypothetical protein
MKGLFSELKCTQCNDIAYDCVLLIDCLHIFCSDCIFDFLLNPNNKLECTIYKKHQN